MPAAPADRSPALYTSAGSSRWQRGPAHTASPRARLPPAGRLAGTPGPLPSDRGGFGVFMAASTLATVVSGYVNQICLGVGGLVNGIRKATRNVGPPHGTSGGAVQRVPQAQGYGASQSPIRTARVRHLRGSRSLARGIVPELRRAEAAAGARALLRLLQARMAGCTRAGGGGAGSAAGARDPPPPRPDAAGQRPRPSA